MKKLYLLLSFLLLSSATCLAQTSDKKIDINEIGSDNIERSLAPKAVTATLNHDAQTVELCFNRPVGTVTVTDRKSVV